MTNLMFWLLFGLVILSVLVSIASGVGFIIYITKASRQARKDKKLAREQEKKKNAELFELFKAEMKKRGVK